MAILKEKIIEKMKAKNLSIAKLEKEAGLTIHSLRNVLKGRIKRPRFGFLVAIAKALDCSPLDFMEPSSTLQVIKEERLSYTKKALLDDPHLMMDCARMIITLLEEEELAFTIEDYAKSVKALYCYSLTPEPREPDSKFARWLIEEGYV